MSDLPQNYDVEIQRLSYETLVWRNKVKLLSAVISKLRPRREDHADSDSWERACFDWESAIESQGLDPNDFA